jgi:bifunctional DNase/RNase
MVEVQLAAVKVDMRTNTPVILLREAEGAKRTLPIFIGLPEATAIALAMQGDKSERPMTHDLMRDMLELLSAELMKVVITELRELEGSFDKVYFAELHILSTGQVLTLSSRPSDAIALAVRTGSPLFVAEEVLDAEGLVLQSDDDEDEDVDGAPANPEETLEQFREFLDSVRPEDFQS